MGKITAYCRIGCPHSDHTRDTLQSIMTTSSNKTYPIEIISVNNDERSKDEVRDKLKNIRGNHTTFPMIVYTDSKNKDYFVGGNDILQQTLQMVISFDTTRPNLNMFNLLRESGKRLFCALLIMHNKHLDLCRDV